MLVCCWCAGDNVVVAILALDVPISRKEELEWHRLGKVKDRASVVLDSNLYDRRWWRLGCAAVRAVERQRQDCLRTLARLQWLNLKRSRRYDAESLPINHDRMRKLSITAERVRERV